LAIKFHYHTASKEVPRLGIRRGDRLCHVYSDASLDELLAWGRAHDLLPSHLDLRNDLPHFDAFQRRLRFCGEGVSRREFVEDVREWRARRRAETTGRTGGGWARGRQ
jgi:hypothetical protein